VTKKDEVKEVRKSHKIPTLRSCLQARKPELIQFLEKICTKKSPLFWYKKSKVKKAVTLVCHIDTAIGDSDRVWNSRTYQFDNVPIRRRILFDKKQGIFVGPDGLGADDRAGVFGVFRVYSSLPEELRPNLLFCDEEETGGHGARSAAKLLPELDESLFMVELDRRGHEDCVFYNKEPDEFVKYIEGFGFKKDTGTFSDISTLGREFNLCSTNLSVGYYNEHTRYETLYVSSLHQTIEKAIALVATATKAQKVWRLPAVVPVEKTFGGYGCHDWMQRSLGYGRHRQASAYTEEELKRYPYLRELQSYGN